MYFFGVVATSNQSCEVKAKEGSGPNVLKWIYLCLHMHHIVHTVTVHARGYILYAKLLLPQLWSFPPDSRLPHMYFSCWLLHVQVYFWHHHLKETISNNIPLFSGLPATSWQISILNKSTLNSKCKDRARKNFVWSTLWRCIFNLKKTNNIWLEMKLTVRHSCVKSFKQTPMQ